MTFGVRVFDTILSRTRGNTTNRNAADFWQAFCCAAGWSFNHERIHSLVDFQYFLKQPFSEDIVILSGHGGDKDGFHFSNRDILNEQSDLTIHAKNKDKTYIFSACLMGKNDALIESLKIMLEADAVFAYRHLIHDHYAFLTESILLSLMEAAFSKKNVFTESDFIKFQVATDYIKNLNSKHVKTHPLRMF